MKSFLQDTGIFLANMIRLVNMSDDVLLSIDIVSDVAYAREIVYEYIPEMQVQKTKKKFDKKRIIGRLR